MSNLADKTAVQITMFRIFNYGSALQAFALSHVINNIAGWHCKTIDYVWQQSRDQRPISAASFSSFLRKILYWRRDRLYEKFLT